MCCPLLCVNSASHIFWSRCQGDWCYLYNKFSKRKPTKKKPFVSRRSFGIFCDFPRLVCFLWQLHFLNALFSFKSKDPTKSWVFQIDFKIYGIAPSPNFGQKMWDPKWIRQWIEWIEILRQCDVISRDLIYRWFIFL